MGTTLKNPYFPRIIITFDDGKDSIYNKAYPILAANNQKAVAYVTSNWVGDSGRLSLSNLNELTAAGWDIGNHGKSHINLKDATITQIQDEVYTSTAYLKGKNFAWRFFCYPYGAYDTDVINVLKSAGVTIGRGTTAGYQNNLNLSSENYTLKVQSCNTADTVSEIEAYIDEIIATGSLGILYLHVIVDTFTGYSYEFLTADFQTISDYLKTKQNAGLLEVVTFSEYLSEYSITEPSSTIVIGTGSLGTSFINNDYPNEYGLTAGTTKQNKQPSLTWKRKNIKHSVWTP